MKNKLLNSIVLLFGMVNMLFAVESNNGSINCTGNCYEPISNAGDDASYYQGSQVMLDGSASYDPDIAAGCSDESSQTEQECCEGNEGEWSADGTCDGSSETWFELSYSWSGSSLIVLDNPSSANPSFLAPPSGLSPGCFNTDYLSEEDCLGNSESWITDSLIYIPINLVVNDGDYDSVADQVMITVVYDNTAPVLNIGLLYEVTKLSEFTIDASSANDDASLTGSLAFNWDIPVEFTQVSNEPSSIITLISPEVGGDYSLGLTVSDGVDDLDLNITVSVLNNQSPYAVPGDDISVGISQLFTLSGSDSFDPDNTGNLTYSWNIDDCLANGFSLADGQNLNSLEINLNAPSQSGVTCSASLVVTDGDGLGSSTWSGEDIFISEIAEASSSSNSYVELYNGTSENVDLTDYSLIIVRNNGTEYVIDLSGESIVPGATFLIIRSSSGDILDLLDNPNYMTFSNLNKMTGDDAVELYKNGELIDTFGDRNNLVKWDVAGVEDGSYNHTLVRKNFVLSGNVDWNESAGASDANASEWLVYDVNTYDYGGSHLNTYCDNFINITTIENLPPLVSIQSDQAGLSLVPGSTLTLTGSIIDPESAMISDGDYEFRLVNQNHESYLDVDINDFSISDGVCMDDSQPYPDNYEGIGCSNNNDCGSGYSCNEDDGIYEISIELVLVLSDDFDHTEDLGIELVADDGTNEAVLETISFDVAESNLPPVANYEVRETCGNSTQTLSLTNGVYQTSEGCEIDIDLSSSSDNTSTGALNYDWEELPFLDLDANGTNELDLSANPSGGYYNIESTNILTIDIPENISTNRVFDCEFSLNDGDLSSGSIDLDFEIVASMPISTEILDTGLFYEYNADNASGFVAQEGFVYEGMTVGLSASAFDPDGDDSSLQYDWDVDGGALVETLGHCDDLAGNIDSVPCFTSDDCQNCSDSQFANENDCLFNEDGSATGNIWGGGCLDNNSGDLAYITFPIHIENDTDFLVELNVEDPDGNESNTIEFSINVLARYPVANAGHDITVVVGESVELVGYLSQDNQEQEVAIGSWDNSGVWDDSGKRIMANYDNYSLAPFDGYTFNWSQTSGTGVALSSNNDVNPTFTAPLEPETLTFSLFVTDPDGHSSESSTVSVTVIADVSPEIGWGVNGNPFNDSGLMYYRYASGVPIYFNDILTYEDETPKGTYAFNWESITAGICSDSEATQWVCTDGNSLSEAECCDNNGGMWGYPQECNDGVSLNAEDCCNNNGGVWSGVGDSSGICELNGNEIDFWNPVEGSSPVCVDSSESWEEAQVKVCVAGNYNSLCNDDSDCDIVIENPDTEDAYFISPIVENGNYIDLNFEYSLENNTGLGSWSIIDTVGVRVSSLSIPESPAIDAYPEHGQITLYWDNRSEDAIDSLTQYADFQGYKLYKSVDYGKTWGDDEDVILSENGDTLGWQPLLIVDYDEDQDIAYCLYDNGDQNCEKVRDLEISGADPYQSWFSFGSNTGLVQSFVDTNVIDGIDYTYTITAYDRGLRPSTRVFGSFNDQTGLWEEQPDHNFTENMAADYYAYHRLDYSIIDSYISENNVYTYLLEVPDGYPSEFSKIEVRDEWPSTNPDGYYMGVDSDGNKLGSKAFESAKGISVNDHNYIEVTPGYAASNITFPSQNDIDDFLTQDCRSVGNGTKKYEIVNLDKIKDSYIKFEIQAEGNSETFQGYASDNACLYAYRVIPNPNQGDNERLDYVPVTVSGDAGNYSYSPISYVDITDFLDANDSSDLNDYIGLPGVDVDLESNTILVPEYVEGFECFELEYLDDADYLNNFTADVDGIRVRFDNAIRNEPSDKFALLYDVQSSPDESLVTNVFQDIAAGGSIGLQYYTSFNKKPSFDYEVELSDGYISESVDPGDACPENGTIGAQLPFKVKNLTTGQYVTLKLNDNGIFNGNRPPWYIPPANDPDHDPGAGDCMWQPGELVYFERDSVFVGTGEDLEFDAQKTYALNLTYSEGHLTDRNPLCNSFEFFIDVGNYEAGDCVYYEGQVWYARSSTSPSSDGYVPNLWDYNDNDPDYYNYNPWKPVYPWFDGTKIVIETQKWYVDGDYWIADMSMLGQGQEVTQSDMDKINVVPNPYIVYSDYNRSPNSLRFTHLPKSCSIKVYTVSGELVNVLNHNDLYDGDHFWDLKNDNGKVISPGLYIYIVKEEETGLEFVGKFAVVR